jgi:hypothetical protein
MCALNLVCLAIFWFFSTATFGQDVIPAGTVIPVKLKSSISLKMRPQAMIDARVMQDVPLPTGRRIRAGAKVVGHLVAVTHATDSASSQISFTFDRITFSGHSAPITTGLLAMASFVEVEEAQRRRYLRLVPTGVRPITSARLSS